VLSAAYDGFYAHLLPTRRYAEMHEVNRRRARLAPRLSPQEAGDAHAMLAWSATYLGRYGEAAEHATAAIEVTRGLRPGVYFHALSWRVWARFMIGDWDGALDDQRDLDRVLEDDPRGLPPGPYGRGYAVASFCAELRGDTMTADAKLQVVRRLLATGLRPGLVNGVGYAVRTLVRRREHAEAWRLFPYPVPEADAACALLEAYTDLVSVEDDRERAAAILERAGLETELGELEGLPCFADRLAGRLAAADGERDRAIELLRRSADGFAGVGAPWEEAWSRLLLAEIAGDRTEAEDSLATFERLGSIGEIERAQAFLAAAAQRS
jgi:tetratricopeptide (TPR) repeat protein